MKLNDLQLEAMTPTPRPFVVIKTKNGRYRTDSDPTHRLSKWDSAWDHDLSQAHVFTQEKARKFLKKRALSGNLDAEREARIELQLVPVQVINGVPSLPKQERASLLSWLKKPYP